MNELTHNALSAPPRRDVNTVLLTLCGLVCALWMLLHVYVVWRLPFSLDELRIVHLGFAVIILTLQAAVASKGRNLRRIAWLFASVMMLGLVTYFFTDYSQMVERVGSPTAGDVVMGSMLVCAVLAITWHAWGPVIPLLVGGTILYALFGNHLGGIFFHLGIDFPRFIGYCSTYFMGTLGSLTGLSATLIIHFLLFGALLQAVGGAELIEKLSLVVGAKFRSGAAQTAVISSSMMGMVSGSIPANVAVTGAFTIPLMKRHGYTPEFAGAVETVSSAGGQITPPIMSIVAFLIAGLTGISYTDIVIAAALPALVYYLSLSFAVVVRTRKKEIHCCDLSDGSEKLRLWSVLRNYGHLSIPVVILTWRILIGESPARAVLYANLSMILVGLLHALISCAGKPFDALGSFFFRVYGGLVSGAKEAAKLAVILGSVGIVMETFTVTGFGQRLSYAIVEMAGGGSTLLLVCFVAILVLFFGMGMPSAGAYLIAVLLTAPAMIKLGFPVLSVHMFVFYFAMLSALTPPVSLGVLVAISISGGKFMGTALTSLRLALPGFLIPFFFLYKPVILDLASSPWGAIYFNMFLLVGMCGMTMAFEGYLTVPLGWMERFLCVFSAILIFHPNAMLSLVGTAILVSTAAWTFIKYRRTMNVAP
jgi:TRAP transporter 4TM/12TM fusion protein